MFMCYLDESGTSELGDGTNHFVFLGLAIPVESWKSFDAQIAACKVAAGIEDGEIHTAWIAKRYPEQDRIPNFASLSAQQRKTAVLSERRNNLAYLASRRAGVAKIKSVQKDYRKSESYIHLTHRERQEFLEKIASIVGSWTDARLFAEVINKPYFHTGSSIQRPMMEYAFTELVQRYEYFLKNRGNFQGQLLQGLLIQDNNDTVSHRFTSMMRDFHRSGTRWTNISHIFETPLFVDSHLTSMVQVADLCAYATRRFLDNNERTLFDLIYSRFDRVSGAVLGIRHFTTNGCTCQICRDHKSFTTQRRLPLSG